MAFYNLPIPKIYIDPPFNSKDYNIPRRGKEESPKEKLCVPYPAFYPSNDALSMYFVRVFNSQSRQK